MRLTPNQQHVLNYLWSFFQQNDQLPPCKTIATHFKWASENAAHLHQVALEKHGYLERNAVNKWKFTQTARTALAAGPLQPPPLRDRYETGPRPSPHRFVAYSPFSIGG